MASSLATTLFIAFFASAFLHQPTFAARKLQELVQEQPLTMTYHKGGMLTGRVSINLIWYGKFTAAQRAILTDFITSLTTTTTPSQEGAEPSISTWWKTTQKYYTKYSKSKYPAITLGNNNNNQLLDESYSLGKKLTDSDLTKLASRGGASQAINVVLTADDVYVDGFCMSRCASHGASARSKSGRFAYVWVGNSATQCPGQCAWPFHQPEYGPQTPPLTAPNGDVGVDGMVINLATMMAGVFTNPFGNGVYQGSQEAPLEAATACTGVYGPGSYPGYTGKLLVDATTGASYNAKGVTGREYLVPALVDPDTSTCSTLV